MLLPKVKSPTSVSQYRPISILCHISKALEKLVAEQVVEFAEQNNLFDPNQSAYRRGCSAQTALIRMLDEARAAADRRMITVSVFFDFTEAFD